MIRNMRESKRLENLKKEYNVPDKKSFSSEEEYLEAKARWVAANREKYLEIKNTSSN